MNPSTIPLQGGHIPTIVHNPYGTSAPPVTAPPIAQPTSTPSTIQQMLTMMQQQQQQHQETIKFETFKEGKTLYSFWKAHSLAKLAASSDPFYHSMVIFDPLTTINTINHAITPAQNSQLYFITTAALGSTLSQQFISQRHAAASDEYITVHANPYPSTTPASAPSPSSAPPIAPTNPTPVGAPTSTRGASTTNTRQPSSNPPTTSPTPAPTPAPSPAPTTPFDRSSLHPAVAQRLATFKHNLLTSNDPTTFIVTTNTKCVTEGPPCHFHQLYRTSYR